MYVSPSTSESFLPLSLESVDKLISGPTLVNISQYTAVTRHGATNEAGL